jgi:hypothetical protein
METTLGLSLVKVTGSPEVERALAMNFNPFPKPVGTENVCEVLSPKGNVTLSKEIV